jgi:hypothetical protein
MLRGGVDVIVIGKLRKWEEFIPIVLTLIDKQSDVLFPHTEVNIFR